jgi:hypothetical protein
MERKKSKACLKIRQVTRMKSSHYTFTSFSHEMEGLETPQFVTLEQVPFPLVSVTILTSLHQSYTKLTVDIIGIITLGLQVECA